MTLEEVVAKILNNPVASVTAEAWDEKIGVLSGVTITLVNGMVLHAAEVHVTLP